MDAERLAMIGALVQLQNQNLLRLQQAIDRRRRERRRRDRVVWDIQWILRRPEHAQNASIPMLASPLKQGLLQQCTAKPTPMFSIFPSCVQFRALSKFGSTLPTVQGTLQQSSGSGTRPLVGKWMIINYFCIYFISICAVIL